MNHELDASLLEEVFQKVNSEATESVSVHDHNFLDISRDCGVHQGQESFALEVKTGSNVADDPMVGKEPLEVFDLPVEICFLGLAADPCIGNLFLFLDGDSCVSSEQGLYVADAVEAFGSGSIGTDALNLPGIGPVAEGGRADIKERSDFSTTAVFRK